MTETESAEFKKSLAELKEGLISLAAMLNKHGEGELWFGIASNGKAMASEPLSKYAESYPENARDYLENYPENAEDSPENLEGYPENYPENAREVILRSLRQQPSLSATALAKLTGLSVDGVKYHLRRLQAGNKLRRIGPDKGGRWEVID